MFDALLEGGKFMWVLLGVSMVALGLVSERVWVLWFKWKVDGLALLDQVRKLIEREDSYSKALKLCTDQGPHPVAKVLQAGLVKGNQPDREIQRTLEEAAVRQLPLVQVRTGYIGMIANAATLLGLLGTIFGLIMAFESVGEASASEKQELLARGISVAMLTTAFGLIVAIPSMVAFSVISARQTKLMDGIEEASISLFNFLSARNRRIRELGPEAFARLQEEALSAESEPPPSDGDSTSGLPEVESPSTADGGAEAEEGGGGGEEEK